MGLDVVLDSVEPLGVVMSDANKLFPTFKVESPQEFAIAPVIRECIKEGVEVGNFLVEMGEDSKQAKLFVDDGELVVGKDSFFEGKDLFPVHAVVKSSYLCQGSTGPCARREQVWFNQDNLARPNQVKTKSNGESF
jgi:hypothetical protein